MPLPLGTTLVTVTEDYTRSDGTVPRVHATFELSHPIYVNGTTIVIDPIEVDVTNGHLSVQLAALPDGHWYRVTQIVDGHREPVRNIPLPATPTTVKLDQLGDVDPVVPGMIRVVSVDGHLPDATGNIDLPGTGGSGGVASVNTKLPDGGGNVTLTAADVGALTQTTGDTRYVQPGALDPYATDADLTAGLAGKADLVGGKVPQAQLPAIALVEFLGTVASQAAMLALTGQRGDWTTRTDLGTDWQLIADDPTQLSSWREMTYPPSPVSSVAGRTGAVVLAKGDVGLANVDNTSDAAKPISTATQGALDGKETAGVAAAAIAGHLTEGDPHSQYLTPAEADALYARQPIVRQAWITTGDINPLPNTSGAWQALSGFELAIPAAVGDYVSLDVNALRKGTANAFLDIGVLVGSSIVRFLASGTSTPGFEGDPGWYTPSAGLVGRAAPRGFTVASDDRDSGNVRFVVAVKADATGILYASSNYPFYWRATNYGPVG
jgi:hypothetical protein